MWTIIQSEIKYSLTSLAAAGILPAAYTIYILAGHPYLNEDQFAVRIFLPFIAGLLPLLIFVKTWVIGSFIEQRSRIYFRLKVSVAQISRARILSGIIPIAAQFFYLFIAHVILIDDWPGITARIFYLTGSNFLIISTLLLISDLRLTMRYKSAVSIFGAGFAVALPVLFVSIVVDRFVDAFVSSFGPAMGIMFFFGALIVLWIDSIIYQKRLSFFN